jgi:tRNA(Ile)-lysidine synthetase-like protein
MSDTPDALAVLASPSRLPALTAATLSSLSLPPDAPICVALSGGRDSVALLAAAVTALGPARVIAHHVRHGLRDDAPDASLCEAVCARLGVPLRVTAFSPNALRALPGDGPQDRARRARYAALTAAAQAHGAAALLTAHHRDDAIETSLIRWLRGAGIEGVAGIRAASVLPNTTPPLWLVRPLLDVTRDELEAFLRALSLPWADDPSNATDAYLRNRLRHHVLPPLADASPNGSLSGMARTLSLLRNDADALSSLCDALIARAGHWTPEPAWYGLLSLLGPPAVTAQVIRRVSRQLCPGHSPSSLAVDEALSRLSSAGRAPWRDGAVEIGREGQWLVLRAPNALPPSLPPTLHLDLRSPPDPAKSLRWLRHPPNQPPTLAALLPPSPFSARLACSHDADEVDGAQLWTLAPLADAARDPKIRDALRARGVPPLLRPRAWGLRDPLGTLRWVPGVWSAPPPKDADCWLWLQDLPWFLRPGA